jgi:hypothetical protein
VCTSPHHVDPSRSLHASARTASWFLTNIRSIVPTEMLVFVTRRPGRHDGVLDSAPACGLDERQHRNDLTHDDRVAGEQTVGGGTLPCSHSIAGYLRRGRG